MRIQQKERDKAVYICKAISALCNLQGETITARKPLNGFGDGSTFAQNDNRVEISVHVGDIFEAKRSCFQKVWTECCPLLFCPKK